MGSEDRPKAKHEAARWVMRAEYRLIMIMMLVSAVTAKEWWWRALILIYPALVIWNEERPPKWTDVKRWLGVDR